MYVPDPFEDEPSLTALCVVVATGALTVCCIFLVLLLR